MRTEAIEIFKYNELSEGAQKAALDNMGDAELDHEWWDGDYEDAKEIAKTLGIERLLN